jgi:hypothetical protein
MKVGIFLTCQYPAGSDMVAALEAQYVMTRLARDTAGRVVRGLKPASRPEDSPDLGRRG